MLCFIRVQITFLLQSLRLRTVVVSFMWRVRTRFSCQTSVQGCPQTKACRTFGEPQVKSRISPDYTARVGGGVVEMPYRFIRSAIGTGVLRLRRLSASRRICSAQDDRSFDDRSYRWCTGEDARAYTCMRDVDCIFR
jgi:hypothetical protein